MYFSLDLVKPQMSHVRGKLNESVCFFIRESTLPSAQSKSTLPSAQSNQQNKRILDTR